MPTEAQNAALLALADHLKSLGMRGPDPAPVAELNYVEPDGAAAIFREAATQQERDAVNAVIAGWDWTQAAQDARDVARFKAAAKNLLDELKEQGRLQRAVLELIVVELNLLRSWLTDFKAEAAAATSLPNFQQRIGGLPNLPARTKAQVIAAIKAEVDADA